MQRYSPPTKTAQSTPTYPKSTPTSYKTTQSAHHSLFRLAQHNTKTKNHSQPIPPRPPKRKQEKPRQSQRSDFTRVRIEPASDESGTDEGGPEVPRGEGEPGDASGHAGRPAFVWVEFDGVDVCAGEDWWGCGGLVRWVG